jgi:hypothetical protein
MIGLQIQSLPISYSFPILSPIEVRATAQATVENSMELHVLDVPMISSTASEVAEEKKSRDVQPVLEPGNRICEDKAIEPESYLPAYQGLIDGVIPLVTDSIFTINRPRTRAQARRPRPIQQFELFDKGNH